MPRKTSDSCTFTTYVNKKPEVNEHILGTEKWKISLYYWNGNWKYSYQKIEDGLKKDSEVEK